MSNNEKREKFIIGIANSEADAPVIQRVVGTWAQMKSYLWAMIEGDREADMENFDNGTKSEDDIEFRLDESVYGYNTFNTYHIDYVVLPESAIPTTEL